MTLALTPLKKCPRACLGAATATLCLLAAAQAAAQERSTDAASAAGAPGAASSWGIGIGASAVRRPYAGAESKNIAVPLLFYESRWLRVSGATADVKLLQKEFGPQSSIGLTGRLKYEDGGYEAGDSPRLAGMADRDGSVWGGAAVTWNTGFARVSGEWLSDLSSKSKGQKLQLQVDRRFGFGSFGLTPRVQAQWLDEKYVDYYFGVRANEAQPGRAQYTGKAATTMEVGLRLDYAIRPRQTVFLDVSATSLPDEIKNSPIVGRSSMSRATVGYIHRF
ncbi:MipA/OmpV family protein [Acidovorax sp. BLS4]|uniref:MipA/OmpV family protein n=1 Tax=Acidovorax sp. BLS4 TaxID=3273430 RepID=UPI002943C4F7|nr:MipA/OmpV family protein [Paracidovorax avenae]WOI43612.1 MipA/OmpV family protein [Paracidovorax avenae]